MVSGPVWEYYSSNNDEWAIGLKRELKYDVLNGFVGKTVIHPNQIPVVVDSLKVKNRTTTMLWKSCHGVMTVRCSLEAVHKKSA